MSTLTQQRPTTISFAPSPQESLRRSALKKNMSITQTYYLAHKARAKLSREAAQPDHDLRLLVGHANLLDSLMIELADAEREQERWFNQSVRGAHSREADRRVQWADKIAETEEEYDSDSSSESDFDEEEDEDVVMANTPSLVSSSQNKITSTSTSPMKVTEIELEEDYEDDEEDFAQLGLVRTQSHSGGSPPELLHDSDGSEDESMPPSPPQVMLAMPTEKEEEENAEDGERFYDEDYYLPRRATNMVPTITVY